MQIAKTNFLWFKKGEVIPEDQLKQNPNWIINGYVTIQDPGLTQKIEKEVEKKEIPKKKDKVEEKKSTKSSSEYYEELNFFDGIGKKTAEDIMKVFSKRESLEKAISEGEELNSFDGIGKKTAEDIMKVFVVKVLKKYFK